MAATITRHETIVVETQFDAPVDETDDESSEPMALPWYRHVPAPGVATSRHWRGYRRS